MAENTPTEITRDRGTAVLGEESLALLLTVAADRDWDLQTALEWVVKAGVSRHFALAKYSEKRQTKMGGGDDG